MRPTAGSRSAIWPCGVEITTLPERRKDQGGIDFQRVPTPKPQMTIDCAALERVSSTKFLRGSHQWGSLPDNQHHITDIWPRSPCGGSTSSASWREHEPPPPSIMCSFYRGTMESILNSCMGAAMLPTARPCSAQWRLLVWSSCPTPLPPGALRDRLTHKATSIVGDPSHPSHSLFRLLPTVRRYRSLRAGSTRLGNIFHQAVWKLSSLPSLPSLPSAPSNFGLWTPPPICPQDPWTFHFSLLLLFFLLKIWIYTSCISALFRIWNLFIVNITDLILLYLAIVFCN